MAERVVPLAAGMFSFCCFGWNKINTDGCSKGNPGPAGIGGIIRNDLGIWIAGFYGRLDDTTSLQAELEAIQRGLELVHRRNISQVIVETDSLDAAKLLSTNPEATHPNRVLITHCRRLMERMHIPIVHTLREGNQCADAMANLGVQQVEKFVELDASPSQLANFLLADISSVAFARHSD